MTGSEQNSSRIFTQNPNQIWLELDLTPHIHTYEKGIRVNLNLDYERTRSHPRLQPRLLFFRQG